MAPRLVLISLLLFTLMSVVVTKRHRGWGSYGGHYGGHYHSQGTYGQGLLPHGGHGGYGGYGGGGVYGGYYGGYGAGHYGKFGHFGFGR